MRSDATSVEEYLTRCSLKTGKLFEAACVLGGNGRTLGAFGLALGAQIDEIHAVIEAVDLLGRRL